jgi:hypothetical protein
MRPSYWILAILIVGLGIAWAHRALATRPAPIAFTFRTGGAFGLSETVELRADGTQRLVSRAPCTRLLHPHARLTRADLLRLHRLAHAVQFTRLPQVIRTNAMEIDMAGRTITVYEPIGPVTVTEAFNAYNPRFDRLYAALADTTPFIFDGPCRGNDA